MEDSTKFHGILWNDKKSYLNMKIWKKNKQQQQQQQNKHPDNVVNFVAQDLMDKVWSCSL